MITTHYEINGHCAIILDPIETEEGRQERQKRWKTAAVRFYKAVEKEGVKMYSECPFDNYTFFEMHEREQERRRKADREDDCYWDEREEREVCDI